MTETPAGARRWQWTVGLAVVAASWLGYYFFQPERLYPAGIGHYRIEVGEGKFHELWFLDAFAILASNDAVAAGLDPYAANPLDPIRRPHVYGPWWLWLHHLGMGREDVIWVGLVLAVGFVAMVMLWWRPRSAAEAAWYAMIFCSMPVLFALERANNDLVIFLILMPVVPCLLSQQVWVRYGAAGWIVLAAELKIYPAAAAVVLLAGPGSRLEAARRAGMAAVLLLLVGWHLADHVRRIPALLPDIQGIFTFGSAAAGRLMGWEAKAARWMAGGIGIAWFVCSWRLAPLGSWRPGPLLERRWLYFVIGAALLVGCFFTGQHFSYRWIFGLWLAPFLFDLMQGMSVPRRVRQWAWAAALLLVANLWVESAVMRWVHDWPERRAQQVQAWTHAGMQPVAWALIAVLIVFLGHYLRAVLLSPNAFTDAKGASDKARKRGSADS